MTKFVLRLRGFRHREMAWSGYIAARPGTTKGEMKPTGLRRTIKRYGLWKLYAMGIAEDLRRLTDPGRISGTSRTDEWSFLVSAIAQHYGPGSEFLDVTRSLPVALWFALHKYEQFEIASVMGPAGPPDPEDVPVERVSVRYVPYTEDVGWLYVFDAAEVKGSLKRGTLIDLEKAPAVFADCPRIRAQGACLLRADPRVDNGNLHRLYRCDPLRVSWPLSGTPGLNMPTDEMFPLPSRDPWYSRFISIPDTLTIREAGNSCCFAQPLEVREYVSNEKPQRAGREFFERGIILAPHLFHRAALADHVDPQGGEWVVKWDSGGRTHLANATAVYVEAPLMFARPPLKTGLWNEGLLATDLDLTTEAVDLAQKGTKSVTLENVFVEFSSLEHVGWERIEQSRTESMEMLRGAWLAREGNVIALQLFLQRFPLPQVSTLSSGFMQYEEGTGRFRFRNGAKLGRNVFDLEVTSAYEAVGSTPCDVAS